MDLERAYFNSELPAAVPVSWDQARWAAAIEGKFHVEQAGMLQGAVTNRERSTWNKS